MNFDLTPEMQNFVDEQIKHGRYLAVDDILRAALGNFMLQTRLQTNSPDELQLMYPDLRRQIAEGIADLRAGNYIDGDEFFDRLEQEELDSASRKTA